MKVGIIGLGLMGASFSKDIRTIYKDSIIYGLDKSNENLQVSFDLKHIDFKLDKDNMSKMDLILIILKIRIQTKVVFLLQKTEMVLMEWYMTYLWIRHVSK